MRRTFKTRKLLVAGVGVAALTYGACSQEHFVGNFMGPPACKTDADCVEAGRGDFYNACGPSGYCMNVSPSADAGDAGQTCDLPSCVLLGPDAGSDGGDAQSDGSIAAADADAGADAASEAGDATTDAASE